MNLATGLAAQVTKLPDVRNFLAANQQYHQSPLDTPPQPKTRVSAASRGGDHTLLCRSLDLPVCRPSEDRVSSPVSLSCWFVDWSGLFLLGNIKLIN